MHVLSPDSPFMRGLSNLIDAIWINILMLVTSIPVITIGAALVSGHDAARRAIIGEGHVTSNYFRAFRQNFARSTLIWLIFGPVAASLVASWIFLQITPLLIPKFAFTIVWIIGFEWVWALQARFENSFGRTLGNAYVFGVSHFVATLGMVAIDAVYLALIAACWRYMPQGLFLLLLMGYGTCVMLHIPLLERVFAPYTRQSAPVHDDANWLNGGTDSADDHPQADRRVTGIKPEQHA
ncbi:YesL family protein [Bifidobacterium apri]|uniref:YesL family protein n=1 Tax=Bifidobacterium apri TaxID=1769423 RepID=UPI0039931B11